jgi:hypothetical protein
MRIIVIGFVALLLCMTGVAAAQEAQEADPMDEVWYWGVEAASGALVAYNTLGRLNSLGLMLDPFEPYIIIWRVDSHKALALVEVDGKLVLYELTPETATRVVGLVS